MSFETGAVHKTTPHLFADLIELLLLTNTEGRGSFHKNEIGDIVDRLPVAAEDADNPPDEREDDESGAEQQDRQERYIEDVWALLEYRAAAFGLAYPFSVEDGRITLRLPLQNNWARVYRLLVACSRLRSFTIKGCRQRWAKAFTNVSSIALRSLVPQHAMVRIFDANSDDRRTYFGTDFRDALIKLGDDLKPETVLIDNCKKQSSSGDAGIDLVAIVPFDDGAATTHALFGQCGAQEREWPTKIFESHPIALRSFYNFLHDPVNVMFFPLSYRSSNGAWVNPKSVTGCIAIDRGRILKLLGHQNIDELVAENWFAQFEAEFQTVGVATAVAA